MAILAKYNCKCSRCNANINKGDAIKFVEIKKKLPVAACVQITGKLGQVNIA